MRERLDELGDNTVVALITFTDPESLIGYSKQHNLGFPVLTDRNRDAYRAFGLGRGSITRVYGWNALRRYIEIFRSNGFAGLRRPTEDTLQLGGDFVVDANGTLVYGFWGDGPDDRPTADELINAVTQAST